MLVISPYAKVGHVDQTVSEHASILKFIEKLFGLPTLASVNKQFDSGTPKNANNLAGGAPFPPRDGKAAISDMTQCFDFAAAPNLYPNIPGAPWYTG
jgi:phospholipase C